MEVVRQDTEKNNSDPMTWQLRGGLVELVGLGQLYIERPLYASTAM